MDPQTASLEMMEKLWTEWFSTVGRMQTQAATAAMQSAAAVADGNEAGPAGPMPGAPPFLTPEVLKRFQAGFLDAMARYCEEYMRSPQFLAVMKQTMDGALTFRQQVNEFLSGAVASGFQSPVGLPPDQAVIVDAVRETERKLRDHIDAISERLGNLEASLDGAGGKRAPAAKKTRKDAAE